jgi:hypothetical protein
MKVVTYATHSYGKFDTLVNNEHGVHVKVLGWGDKWMGYMVKAQKIYEYIQTLPPQEIVVCIDGFDSEILRNLDGLEETFKSFKCGVLLSREVENLPKILQFTNRRIYGTCKNQIQANAGMYMGTVEYLKIFLENVLDEKSKDDQRNFNTVCSRFEWLKIDVDKKIFFNSNYYSKTKTPEGAYFLSQPGTPSFFRTSRVIGEYYEFFIREISLVFLIAALILFMWKM